MSSVNTIPIISFDPPEGFDENLNHLYRSVLDDLIRQSLVPESLNEVILSYKYQESVERINPKEDTRKSPRYSSGAKLILKQDGKSALVVNCEICNAYPKVHVATCIEMLVCEIAVDHLPPEIKIITDGVDITDFASIASYILRCVSIKVVAESILSKVSFDIDDDHFDLSKNGYESQEELFDEFSIICQRIHWEYQKNTDLNEFSLGLIREMIFALKRCAELSHRADIIPETDNPLYNLIQSAHKCLHDVMVHPAVPFVHEDFNVALKELFASQCTSVSSELPFSILITESPKSFYFGKTQDSVPCIVAFIDLLGFSESIMEYERNPNTDSLFRSSNGLRKAIEESKKFARLLYRNNPEYALIIDVKTFSDNICISFPYYGTTDDFSRAVSLITLMSSYVQITLLAHGFLCRGAISLGRHYSNEFTIHSSGIVKAYKLEQSVIYPAIVIDPEILHSPLFNVEEGGMHMNFIEMKYHPNWSPFVFINPNLSINMLISVHSADPIFKPIQHPFYVGIDKSDYPCFDEIRNDVIIQNPLNPKYNLSKCYEQIKNNQFRTCDENIARLNGKRKELQKWVWFRSVLNQFWLSSFEHPFSYWKPDFNNQR